MSAYFIPPVIDDLTTGGAAFALSARQGKILKGLIDGLGGGGGGGGISALTGDVTASGTGSVVATIGAGKVTNSMLAGSIAAGKLVGTDIVLAQSQVTGLIAALSAAALDSAVVHISGSETVTGQKTLSGGVNIPYNPAQDGHSINFIGSSGGVEAFMSIVGGNNVALHLGGATSFQIINSSYAPVMTIYDAGLVGLNTAGPAGSFHVVAAGTGSRSFIAQGLTGQVEDTFALWDENNIPRMKMLGNRLRFFNLDSGYGGGSANYERLTIQPVSNEYLFRSEAGGTGTVRPIVFTTGSPSVTPAIFRAAASQAANIVELQSFTGTPLAFADSNANFYSPSFNTLGASGQVALFDRGGSGNYFALYCSGDWGVYDTAGGFTSWTLQKITGRMGVNTQTPGGQIHVVAKSASTIGAIIETAASQTANAFQLQTTAGVAFAEFLSTGSFGHLLLTAPAGQGNGCGFNFVSNGGAYSGLFTLDGSGNMVFRNSNAGGGMYFDYQFATYFRNASSVIVAQFNSSTSSFQVNAATAATIAQIVRGATSQAGNLVEYQSASAVVGSTVSENAYFTTRKTTAPADAELVASEAAWWLDATVGGAMLMVKAKNSAGTVVTGSITLT